MIVLLSNEYYDKISNIRIRERLLIIHCSIPVSLNRLLDNVKFKMCGISRMVDAGINMRELPQDATTEWRIFFRSDASFERSYTLKMSMLTS